MKKFKSFYNDLLFVSKVVDTNNKKARILLSVLFSNLVVLLDLAVIIIFSYIIQKTEHSNILINQFLSYSEQNSYLFILIVIFRFVFVYADRMNLEILKLNVQEKLRAYFIKEVFDRGNYSMADAFFYVNSLSIHVSTFYGSLASLISFFLQILIFGSYLIFTDINTGNIFAIGSIILYFPTKYFVKMLRKYSHESFLNMQEINRNVEKVLDNLYLIKILKKVDYEIENYDKTQKSFFNSQVQNLKFGTVNSILPNFITIFILAVLLTFFNFEDLLTLEFIGVLLRLFQTLGNFNRSLSVTTNSHVHLERLYQIDKNKGLSNRENFINDFSKKENQKNNIVATFKHVNFKYFNSEEAVFKDLNFNLYKNKHTVLTGANGSGKSTLLGLLSGVFYATSGSVECFSNNIGYIGAKPMIINDTLRNNLQYGSKKLISDELLYSYIIKFNVFENDNMINLQNTISNKTLSSGQMQKIAFIRALVMDVDLLLLDESTSNLDIDSKNLIYKILEETKITIVNSTHDLSSLKKYDYHIEIVNKKDGKDLLISEH